MVGRHSKPRCCHQVFCAPFWTHQFGDFLNQTFHIDRLRWGEKQEKQQSGSGRDGNRKSLQSPERQWSSILGLKSDLSNQNERHLGFTKYSSSELFPVLLIIYGVMELHLGWTLVLQIFHLLAISKEPHPRGQKLFRMIAGEFAVVDGTWEIEWSTTE